MTHWLRYPWLATALMCLSALSARAASAAPPKVAVFPIVPLADEASPDAAEQMTQAIVEEFQGTDALEVVAVDLPKGSLGGQRRQKRPAKSSEALQTGLQTLAQGAKQVERLRFPKAIRLLKRGIAAVERQLEGLEEHDRLVEAYLLLAEAYYRRGDETSGKTALEKVVRLRPTKRLDPDQYPPIFLNEFRKVRARMWTRGRGRVRVTTSQPGATVTLNGKPLGSTPLLIENILPGQNHLVVRAQGRSWGAPIEVPQASTLEREVELGGDTSGGKSARAAMRNNHFSAGVRALIQRQARDRGAQFAVVAVMGEGDGIYTVSPFLGQVRLGNWTSLEPVIPDVDMLSAAIEAHALLKQVKEKLGGIDDELGRDDVRFITGKQARKIQEKKAAKEKKVSFIPPDYSPPQPQAANARAPGGSRAPVKPSVSKSPVAAKDGSRRQPAAAKSKRPVGSQAASTVPERRQPPVTRSTAGPERAASGSDAANAKADQRGPILQEDKTLDEVEAIATDETTRQAARRDASRRSGPLGEPVDLEAEAGGSESVFEKWWFWTAVGVGVAGAAAGTTLGVMGSGGNNQVEMYAVW